MSSEEMLEAIQALEKQIKTEDISTLAEEVRFWRGADVVISPELCPRDASWIENQPMVIGLQQTMPRRRLVITPHAKVLSWLFFQLKRIFWERLRSISKYDFYGMLAQSALDFLESHEDDEDPTELLCAVLETSIVFVRPRGS